MALVKVKKEMNLAQLIEWGLKNEITSKEYTCNNKDGYKSVIFSTTGIVHLNSFQTYLADDKYKVEVEEEITEYTKLYLVERYISSYEDSKLKYKSHQNKSINSVLKNNMPHIKTTHFYTEVNNELILIWKNGKLAE